MPRCIVFGPREVDVVSIVQRECPAATVTKFDEDGGITGIFPDDPKDKLTAAGLHVIVLEAYLSSVVWRPFLVRGSFSAPEGAAERIAEILRQRFNGRPTREKARFEIPIPIPDHDRTEDPAVTYPREYNLRMEVVHRIQDLMYQHNIPIEIGLARW